MSENQQANEAGSYQAPQPPQAPQAPMPPQADYQAPAQYSYAPQQGQFVQPGVVQGGHGAPQSNNLAIAGMILGISSLVLAWIIAILGWGASITGLVLSINALRKGQSKGMAITGIITSSVGIIFSLISSIIGVIVMTAITSM